MTPDRQDSVLVCLNFDRYDGLGAIHATINSTFGGSIMNTIHSQSTRGLFTLSVAAVLAACSSGSKTQPAASAADTLPAVTAAQTSGLQQTGTQQPEGMSGTSHNVRNNMSKMSGMADMQQGGATAAMMDSITAQMQRMKGMSVAQMQAVMPMHRQMTANMLAQMNSEMRGMKMTASPAWTSTMDSLRQDIVHMPEMSAPELTRFMPAHQARVERLMAMHRSMMKGMKE
jgi:hypothetical protein